MVLDKMYENKKDSISSIKTANDRLFLKKKKYLKCFLMTKRAVSFHN